MHNRTARRHRCRGQGFYINFAARIGRQFCCQAKTRGHHVVGQARAQRGKHLRRRNTLMHPQPGMQASHPVVLHLLHHRLPDARHPEASRLDLAGFNALTAQFDLPVGAAREMQLPLTIQPAAIIGAVHARTGR